MPMGEFSVISSNALQFFGEFISMTPNGNDSQYEIGVPPDRTWQFWTVHQNAVPFMYAIPGDKESSQMLRLVSNYPQILDS